MTRSIMLSAIQPSNKLTLGNYTGAIRNWVQAQRDHQCYFFVVDMHAITVKQDPEKLREQTYYAIATYIAAGIDPEQNILFIQSHVPEHAELAWVLNCFTTMGELGRMTQFKEKSEQQQHVSVGLFDYPVLMAADILLYDTELVPVGVDQVQHIELARDIAKRMNNRFGELFVLPEPSIPKLGGKIMSLQEPLRKMSKSDDNENASIFLSDTTDQIVKKIKRAKTDSGNTIEYRAGKPGISNLLSIHSALSGENIDSLVDRFQGKLYGTFKNEVAEVIAANLTPLRLKITQLLNDRAMLDDVLKQNAERARAHASQTLKRVYERVGFIPRA